LIEDKSGSGIEKTATDKSNRLILVREVEDEDDQGKRLEPSLTRIGGEAAHVYPN
jgi:hypothetical protein